ncbi:MAG TPA: hypothetical protein VEW69_05610 [Alphaproteobacteria bacterium]|nr:hypothetical protein [Alphaproteobacteria bacterium]
MSEDDNPKDPKYKVYDRDWGTAARQGYEDRPVVAQPRRVQARPQGSPLLNKLGGLLIVCGIAWGTYLVSSGGNVGVVLQENRGPALVLGLGVLTSVVGRFIR